MRKIFSHLKENWIKYGFETLVVAMGILGAYNLNNWNETRKNRLIEIQIYKDLQNSLQGDSIQLVKIFSDLESSLNVQKEINNLGYTQLIYLHEPDSLLDEYHRGIFSFFPKEGVYQLLIKNNQLDLIRSDMLKSRLVELYDFLYQRYKNIDIIIDDKFEYSFVHVAFGKMKFSTEYLTRFGFINKFDPELFEKHYEDLREVTRNLISVSSAAFNNIDNIQKEVNSILLMIQQQLKKQ